MSGVQHRRVAAEDAGQRLDRWLRRAFPTASQGLIQKLLRKGELRVDGRRAEASLRLEAGQEVRLPPQLSGATAVPAKASRPPSGEEAAALLQRVLHSDRQVIVLDKPAGLAVQGGSKQNRPLDHLLAALVPPGEAPPRLVHRLDRDTSGALVLARTAAAARALTAAFRERRARKLYLALVEGRPTPPAGRIALPLAKGGEAGRERMGVDEDEGDEAVSLYAVAATTQNGRASLVALSPLTGRTHQLRAHLAAIGHPILGDGKYGAREAGQLLLHASEIAVPHPDDGTTLRVAAPLPEHFAKALERLTLGGEKFEQRLASAIEKLIERGA
jgi:23S rRNA pseudouridine955/2504/2580 synthase